MGNYLIFMYTLWECHLHCVLNKFSLKNNDIYGIQYYADKQLQKSEDNLHCIHFFL